MPSITEPPNGGKGQIRPPLRLVHPVEPKPPKRGRKPSHHAFVFSREEEARLRAAIQNARRLFGSWGCLADVLHMSLPGLAYAARSTGHVSAAVAVRLARALGVPLESLYRAPSDASKCPTCGASRGAS